SKGADRAWFQSPQIHRIHRDSDTHCDQALSVGMRILQEMKTVNQELRAGIGIHTGTALLALQSPCHQSLWSNTSCHGVHDLNLSQYLASNRIDRDHDRTPKRLQSFSNQFFTREGP
ncbi:MAG: hypothetical protein ACOC2H_09660, partial [Spirochaetota bacterium]